MVSRQNTIKYARAPPNYNKERNSSKQAVLFPPLEQRIEC